MLHLIEVIQKLHNNNLSWNVGGGGGWGWWKVNSQPFGQWVVFSTKRICDEELSQFRGRIIGKARGEGRDSKLLYPHNFSKDSIVTKRRETRGEEGGGGNCDQPPNRNLPLLCCFPKVSCFSFEIIQRRWRFCSWEPVMWIIQRSNLTGLKLPHYISTIS